MSRSTLFSLLALGAAVVAAVIVVFAPTYTTCDSDAACHGDSAFAVNGWWILVVVSVPVVLALIPVLIQHKIVRVIATAMLWICCVVALLSVGIFFVPAGILMTIAVTAPDPVAASDASINDR
jgi:hypothetical protein